MKPSRIGRVLPWGEVWQEVPADDGEGRPFVRLKFDVLSPKIVVVAESDEYPWCEYYEPLEVLNLAA